MGQKILYVHIVEQTHEEEVEMYMKSTKLELIEMLIQCNKYLPKPGTIRKGWTQTNDCV